MDLYDVTGSGCPYWMSAGAQLGLLRESKRRTYFPGSKALNLYSFYQTPGGDRCGSKYRGTLPSLCVCSLATYVHLNNRNAAYSSTTQWMKTLKWDEGCVTPLSSSLGTDWLTMPEFFHLMVDVREVFAWLKIHSSVKCLTGLDRKKKRCNCSVITSFKKQKTLGHALLTTN